MPRRRPPTRSSPAGPLVFVLLVVALVAVLVGQGQAAMGDAVVQLVSERDTLLRQGPIRALVASRVGPETDLAADPNGAMRSFDVNKGETAATVARRLEDERLIRSSLAFLLVVYDAGKEDQVQAGLHRISPAMTPREIAEALTRNKGREEQVTLRIIEGWRITQIAEEVNKIFPTIGKDTFLKAAVVGKRTQPSLAGLDAATPLEGFLYPDTYFFKPDATVETVISTLLDTFESRAGTTLRTAAAQQRREVYDIVKLASIVEREARDRRESKTIAGVYANRLTRGMKLDADPTIQYAVGEWRELLLADLENMSPYNTYKVAGLPPTPISSPGLAALEGAATPEKHDYLYFVADPKTGTHLFAKTLDEQEANRVKVGNK
ncbi:MAG: endolytic transglycosylase MltG [Chloroflexi bacterium]|nr:endolytic transglycosylase MltG [Chloroflexota bacterium]